jgi:MFS family permease
LGQLSLLFVLFSLPSGYIGAALGRRRTIMAGIIVMATCIALMFFLPVDVLTILLTTLPAVGNVPIIGVILMVAGIAWALINVNSLPMVVDMTEPERVGTYTGLYYLFSTLAAILGPIVYGFIIQFSGGAYSLLMLVSPIFMALALISIAGVTRGEAEKA